MHAAAGGFTAKSAVAIRCWAELLSDPHGMEGPVGEIEGLGLLDIVTVLTGEKTLRQAEGACLTKMARLSRAMRCTSARREVRTARGRSLNSLMARWTAQCLKAAKSPRLRAWAVRRRPPARGAACGARNETGTQLQRPRRTLDALADHCEAHLDCDARRPARSGFNADRAGPLRSVGRLRMPMPMPRMSRCVVTSQARSGTQPFRAFRLQDVGFPWHTQSHIGRACPSQRAAGPVLVHDRPYCASTLHN